MPLLHALLQRRKSVARRSKARLVECPAGTTAGRCFMARTAYSTMRRLAAKKHGTRGKLHPHEGAIFQAETLHLLVKRRAVDAQGVGRGVPIPLVAFQHFEDDPPLGFFER